MSEQCRKKNAFVQAISGFVSGAISTCCMHPLDLVKVRMQGMRVFRKDLVHDGLEKRDLLGIQQRTRIVPYVLKIVHIEGISGLYRGLFSNVFASSATWGTYFVA